MLDLVRDLAMERNGFGNLNRKRRIGLVRAEMPLLPGGFWVELEVFVN